MLIEFRMERSDEGSQCAICTDDYDAQRTHDIDISAAGYILGSQPAWPHDLDAPELINSDRMGRIVADTTELAPSDWHHQIDYPVESAF